MNASTPACTRSLVLIVLAALAAACGGKDEEATSNAEKAQAAPPAATGEPAPAAPTSAADERMANAVVTGKTSAAVDLKYDVLAKPEVGQPVEIELVFIPRAAADTLEVEVTGMEGLTVVNGGALRFVDVHAGERYDGKILVQAGAPGLYYIGLAAKMISKVQTEVRTFSVPVVVGTVPAVTQKTAPATDASGQPVESMPAVETGAGGEAVQQ